MRPFEIATCALLAASLLFARTFYRSSRLSGALLIWTALACAAVQVVYEGWRIQMAPAYLLAIVYLFSRVTWGVPPPELAPWDRDPRIGRIARGFAGMVLVIAAVAASIIMPIFTFPEPTGPLKVGTMSYAWSDESREDPWRDHASREIMVQLWYPAEPSTGAAYGPFLRDATNVGRGLMRAQMPFLPPILLDHFKFVKSHSYTGAPVSDNKPAYPVVIFCHGYGGYRNQNTALCEDLASHGYIVVAPEFAYSAAMSVFPDGREATYMNPLRLARSGKNGSGPILRQEDLLAMWVQDVRFVADQLERVNSGKPGSQFQGRLDLNRLGIVGHSFGGSTAINLCRVDPRFKAGFDLDGHPNALNQGKPVQTPFAFFMAASFLMSSDDIAATGTPRSVAEEIAEGSRATRQIVQSSSRDSFLLVLKGSRHETFTDMPLFSPYPAAFGMGADLSGLRAINIVDEYVRAFFDSYLKGERAALLNGPTSIYPEVQFERSNPAPAAPPNMTTESRTEK